MIDPAADSSRPTAEDLARQFAAASPLTIGLEEEVMLLDPETLDLCPRAEAVLDRLGGDPRFKPELPAAQVEIITEPTLRVDDAIAQLEQSRRDLARAAEGIARPAIAGVHPFAAPEGELTRSGRYKRTIAEYGPIARRQLVASLQVHVAPGDPDLALTVYNGLRPHLPDVAALAANAPVYGGRDTGLASVRPKIAELLPRQGVPPSFADWEEFAAELRWGGESGVVPEPRNWWWELRPHPHFGTLELRVPDAQTTLAEAGAVTAVIQALAASLAASPRGDAEPVPGWRIEENRWSASRYGVEGSMADLRTGRRAPTREWLETLLSRLEPHAEELGSSAWLERGRALAGENGALRQRRVLKDRGAVGLADWLAERFLDRPGPP